MSDASFGKYLASTFGLADHAGDDVFVKKLELGSSETGIKQSVFKSSYVSYSFRKNSKFLNQIK